MRRLLLLAALMLLATEAAQAACTSIAVTALSFGSYTSQAMTNSTATVTVNCTSGFTYQIGLGAGDSGTATARTMQAGSNSLNYGLYQDSTHTTNWGDTAGTTTVNGTGNGANQVYTIYAQVPSMQLVAPGSYTDSLSAYVVGGPTTTLAVSATLAASCTVTATAMAFGSYSNTALTSTATVTPTCTNTTPYNVGLDVGTATGATVSTRGMFVSGTPGVVLNYGLYSDAGFTVVWGPTVGTNTVAGTGTGAAQSITVYGQVLAGQLVAPGAYTDTITATVTY